MDKELIHLLVQFPLLAGFIGFVIWLAKFHRAERQEETSQWRAFIDERNGRSEKAQGAVAGALVKVAEQLGENEKILERIRERVGD